MSNKRRSCYVKSYWVPARSSLVVFEKEVDRKRETGKEREGSTAWSSTTE